MDSVSNSLEKRQSSLIKAMRFPLIVLVVIAHSAYSINPSDNQLRLYHFIQELLSHNLCKIAVCWFFVFAGYFFFLNLPDNGFTYKWLVDKWKRRLKTLLIPFVLWNLLSVTAYFIKSHLYNSSGLSLPSVISAFLSYNNGPLEWFILGPANRPLWFMRDLMVMCLLTPILYTIFKKAPKYFGILFLIVLFFLPVEMPVLTWRGYFFFSIGSFLGINKINLLSLCREIKWPATIIAIILLIIATIYNDSQYHLLILRPFYPFGMITLMNICDHLISNKLLCDKLCSLSAAVFFIYASHEIFIIGGIKDLLSRLLGNSSAGIWIRYFLTPAIVISICLGLYYLLNRIMPRTLAFACGGRSKK